MTEVIDVIGQWVIDHHTLRHFIIAGGIILQGELTSFLGVTLISKNYLTWSGFLFSVFAGVLLYDGFLFSLGKSLRNKPLGMRWSEKIKNSGRMQRYLRHHMKYFLFVARFLLYVNVAAVVLAGLTNMKFKEFVKNRLFADVFWVSVLTLGSYLIISGLTLLNLKQIEIGIAVFLILAFAGNALLRKVLAKAEERHAHPV